ncbi:protein, SNF2 family, partial [Teladorsagia circumcincta]
MARIYVRSEIKAEAFPQEEVDVKPDHVVPEPLIQPSANLFDDRDDATPPMRTDVVEEEVEVSEQQDTEVEPEAEPAPEPEPDEQKEMSPEPPVTCSGGIAAADYSTLSDETQPAIAETDEKSVDTTSLAIAEDEEAKVDVEPEEDVSDEPTPGPSSSRDPSPEESEVTEEPETEVPSVKLSKRSRNKDRVATLSKEETFDDRDATPSEVAESTDGVFTEPSTPAPEGRKPKRLPIVRSRKKKSVDDSGDDDDDFVPDGRSRKSGKRVPKPSKEVGDDDDELEEVDKRAVAKVKRYRQKKSHSNNDNDEEDFNSDYTIVDRVVDVGTGDDGLEYALVKWKSLAYDEVTWEPVESIPEEKKEKPRPKASEWSKMPDDIIWKDGNTLREYQFEGVDWLLYCYYNEFDWTIHSFRYGIHGPFLIVVPLSTIHNWTWRKNLVKLDALITTFEMVVTDCEFLRKIPFRVCVIDEAHRLKNRNCKLLTGGLHAFRMEHRVLLTGTPLQNNIEELFSLLNFLHPQQFSSSAAFLEQFGQCQSDEQVQKLQEILKPMMLRRLKEDVEKSLQPKEETIIEVQLSDMQKKYYRAILERNFSHLCKGWVICTFSHECYDGVAEMLQSSFPYTDSDRFVFLLCTRAGGLGINLTAADTVIIFDSDWNPQNDLQAQARCHRIGQTKMVKVYRLVTANTYEREMFDKGAYGSIMDENVDEGSKFSEEDIETILQRRTTTITLEPGQKGSLFAKAAFNSTHNRGDDIDIDDPNFWTKWAEKAQVDIEKATATPDARDLIMQEPRKRTKRFEENSLKEGEDSDGSDELGKGRKRGGAQGSNVQSANRKRRRGDDEDGDYVNYRPDELAFNKSEYFK